MKRKRHLSLMKNAVNLEEPSVERCQNPWNGECANTDVLVYIFHSGERRPIHKIMEKYGCSHVTAWRKLKSYRKTALAQPTCETS